MSRPTLCHECLLQKKERSVTNLSSYAIDLCKALPGEDRLCDTTNDGNCEYFIKKSKANETAYQRGIKYAVKLCVDIRRMIRNA